MSEEPATNIQTGDALEPVLYTLASIYALVTIYTVIKIIQLHIATRTWTRQKFLHYLVCLCTLGKLENRVIILRMTTAYLFIFFSYSTCEFQLHSAIR